MYYTNLIKSSIVSSVMTSFVSKSSGSVFTELPIPGRIVVTKIMPRTTALTVVVK